MFAPPTLFSLLLSFLLLNLPEQLRVRYQISASKRLRATSDRTPDIPLSTKKRLDRLFLERMIAHARHNWLAHDLLRNNTFEGRRLRRYDHIFIAHVGVSTACRSKFMKFVITRNLALNVNHFMRYSVMQTRTNLISLVCVGRFDIVSCAALNVTKKFLRMFSSESN